MGVPAQSPRPAAMSEVGDTPPVSRGAVVPVIPPVVPFVFQSPVTAEAPRSLLTYLLCFGPYLRTRYLYHQAPLPRLVQLRRLALFRK